MISNIDSVNLYPMEELFPQNPELEDQKINPSEILIKPPTLEVSQPLREITIQQNSQLEKPLREIRVKYDPLIVCWDNPGESVA